MLVMQASQASNATAENKEVPEPTRQSPKKSSNRAERSERRRNSKKAAPGKKAVKRSKQTKQTKQTKQSQAKPKEVPPIEVAEITTFTEPQTAEELSTLIEASARKGQKTLGAEGKEASDNESKGSVPSEQTATAQKLDDILDILESSKGPKKPEKQVKVAHKVKPSSTDTKRKAAVVTTLNKRQKSGQRPDVDPDKAAAMISSYSDQLLAHLKANPEETFGSLYQLRVILQILADALKTNHLSQAQMLHKKLLRGSVLLKDRVWNSALLIESITEVFPGLTREKSCRQ